MGKLTESANQLISSIALRDDFLYDQEIMKHGGAMKQFKDAMLNNGFHFSYQHVSDFGRRTADKGNVACNGMDEHEQRQTA